MPPKSESKAEPQYWPLLSLNKPDPDLFYDQSTQMCPRSWGPKAGVLWRRAGILLPCSRGLGETSPHLRVQEEVAVQTLAC